MSTYANVIVGLFRRIGNILSFARKREYGEIPYKHLRDKLGKLEPKRESEAEPDDIPLPKSSAKRPNLRIIGGKDVKN